MGRVQPTWNYPAWVWREHLGSDSFFCVFFFLFSWPCHVACRILTLGPGTESGRWPVKVLSPNHPTAQEFSGLKLEEDAKGQQGGRSENRLLWGLWWRGTVEGCWPSNLTAQPCSFHPPSAVLMSRLWEEECEDPWSQKGHEC